MTTDGDQERRELRARGVITVAEELQGNDAAAHAAARHSIYPQSFSSARASAGAAVYLCTPLAREAVAFFERKGLAAIKEEDRSEQWYEDWLTFQTSHQLYARLLTPRSYSPPGAGFDVLQYARFLEVCAYFSPAHGYSLHVTLLGLCAILMGDNPELKREAITTLESGGLLAFGVSERAHGSDLLSNEFTVAETAPGRFIGNGSKYYIGNANAAAIIAILARKEHRRGADAARRATPVLFALRPRQARGFCCAQKIRTLGVRSAFVGGFDVRDHEFSASDVIADGRQAWEAIFGTITLGKFLLGFGSIGICEHAFHEAAAHLSDRVLYGKPVSDMPHIRATMVQAYARLTAMKLFAFRALDYVHASGAADQRFQLFAAVQKARLSTEGVKVVALLSECIGARGFESETYFEMALRDVQLIPSLEGSTHINLGLTAQFIPNYFGDPDPAMVGPPALVGAESTSEKDALLMEACTGSVSAIRFPRFLNAYCALMQIANVRRFVRAAKAFQLCVRGRAFDRKLRAETPEVLALGRCQAIVAYAQLVAEHATILDMPAPIVAAIFDGLVIDFNTAAISLASCSALGAISPMQMRRMVSVPVTTEAECDFVAEHMAGAGAADGRAG